VMNQLNGPTSPEYTYLIFYASVVDGQMWCPVRAELPLEMPSFWKSGGLKGIS